MTRAPHPLNTVRNEARVCVKDYGKWKWVRVVHVEGFDVWCAMSETRVRVYDHTHIRYQMPTEGEKP